MKKPYNKFEEGIAQTLEKSKAIHFQYETRQYQYVTSKERVAHYIPDFVFPGSNIIIEAKGYFNSQMRAKHMHMKEQHPQLDIRLVFMGNPEKQKLTKKGKMTYAAWCKKKGLQYAYGAVPASWLSEIAEQQALMKSAFPSMVSDDVSLLKDTLAITFCKQEGASPFLHHPLKDCYTVRPTL